MNDIQVTLGTPPQISAELPEPETVSVTFEDMSVDVQFPRSVSFDLQTGVGPQGPKGNHGDDYVLTEEDKDDIAELAAEKVVIPEVPVQDVQVNGVSVLTGGVANVDMHNYVKKTDYATQTKGGVVKIINGGGGGLQIDQGYLLVAPAADNSIKTGQTTVLAPIIPGNQHAAAFYGLAKAAGDSTQSASSNPVGTYTDEAKSAIRQMIGAPSLDDIPEAPVQDVQVNGVSVLGQDGVAEIPKLSQGVFGVAATNRLYGIDGSNGVLSINPADSASIKAANNDTAGRSRPIVPVHQHESAFYGLAKAAGDSTQSGSENPVGTYTDEAKAAIRTMLDVPASSDIPSVPVQDVQVNGASIVNSGVAEIPKAGASLGVVRINSDRGINISNGMIFVNKATSAVAKAGVDRFCPTVPYNQHESAFYGLAKVAGHDEKDSSLPVGTYTDEAKAAIKTMIGVPTMSDILTAVHDSYPAAEGAEF